MSTSTEKMLGALADSSVVKMSMPVIAAVTVGYLGAPYVATGVREGFPYAYGFLTKTYPEQLSYTEYYGVYVPMREHVVNFVYQNGSAICATAGLASYYALKGTYNLASSIGSSVWSIFSSSENKNDQKELGSVAKLV